MTTTLLESPPAKPAAQQAAAQAQPKAMKFEPDDPRFTQALVRGFIKARGIAIAQNQAFDEAEKAKLEATQR